MSGPGGNRRMQGERGAALIMVLLVITILVVVVIEGVRTMQVDLAGSAALHKGFESKHAALSGLEMAKRVLLEDLNGESGADHEGEPWADFLRQDEVPLPDIREHLQGTIVDEHSKFPINSLLDEEGSVSRPHRAVLHNLLTGPVFGLSDEDADAMIAAFVDWLDTNHEPAGFSGAEDDTYQLDSVGYEARDGEIRSLAEVRLIKGITDALYYGTEGNPGLMDLLTVYSRDSVNINTASPQLLAALIKQDESGIRPEEAWEFALEMVEYRRDPMHFEDLSSPGWYTNVLGSLSIHLHDVVTTESSVYSVSLTARSGSGQRRLFAVLERSGPVGETQDEQAQATTSFLELQ
ncbi:MAG: type II secretion system minor pseudopilin GspK [Desulfovibrionales bacterium]